MLGFDHYGDLPDRLDDVLAGRPLASHTPSDRRTLLPISPVKRPEAVRDAAASPATTGCRRCRGSASTTPRSPRSSSPRAATGAAASARSRRSAAPSSPATPATSSPRPPGWPTTASREVLLVSENSTSYGKDLDARGAAGGALERLLGELAAVPGPAARARVVPPAGRGAPAAAAPPSPARPGVAPYFDLSFQHASAAVLRRMRRFGSRETFLALCREIRALEPEAGIRSQRHRRLPRRDRGGPRRARGVPLRGRARRGRGVRLLRRGRHRGARPARQGRPDRDRRPRRADHPARRARRGGPRRAPGRHQVEVLVERVRRRRRTAGWAAPRTRARTSTASAVWTATPSCSTGSPRASWCAGRSTDAEGDRPGRRGAGRRDRRCRHRARVRPRHRCARRCRSVVTDAGPGRTVRPDGRGRPGATGQHRERADRGAPAPRAGLPRRAVRRPRPELRLAVGGVRGVRHRVAHRHLRRRPRPPLGARHRLRQDRRPDRRQGPHRRRAGRAVDAGRAARGGSRSPSRSASWGSRCCASGCCATA